jgi:hypothetical protein
MSIPIISKKRCILDSGFKGVKFYPNSNMFYNYDPRNYRNISPDLAVFLPMIKNKTELVKYYENYNLEQKPEYILSLNEPDLIGGLNQHTVEQTLKIHKEIEEVIQPKYLSSPAVTKRNGMPFLLKFMEGNTEYKPRCDFICIHYYDYDANEFLKFVDLFWTTFKKPIWITEFSIVDWTKKRPINNEVIKNFMNIAIKGLEERPYVIKYFWFSNTTIHDGLLKQMSLYDVNTKDLTEIGRHFFSL